MFDPNRNSLRSAGALLLLSAAAAAAHADTLPPAPLTLLDHTQLVSGSFSSMLDFLVPAAGTVSVELRDLRWPDSLSGISVSAQSLTSTFASLGAPGEVTFNVDSPGHYFAAVSGTTQGAFAMGLYSLDLNWVALSAAPVSSVPLPPGSWLLLSGVAAFGGFVLRRRKLSSADFAASPLAAMI